MKYYHLQAEIREIKCNGSSYINWKAPQSADCDKQKMQIMSGKFKKGH